MAIKSLYRAQAFGPGSDMWVIPSKESSNLNQKMDWYLNFQLSKAHDHQSQSLSPQLRSLLNANQLQMLADSPAHTGALMLSAEHSFPTKTVIEVPFDNKKKWVEHIHVTWQNLGQPALRVFLPSPLSPDEFKDLWPGPAAHDVLVVPF